MCFCKIEDFPNGEICERSFWYPPPHAHYDIPPETKEAVNGVMHLFCFWRFLPDNMINTNDREQMVTRIENEIKISQGKQSLDRDSVSIHNGQEQSGTA